MKTYNVISLWVAEQLSNFDVARRENTPVNGDTVFFNIRDSRQRQKVVPKVWILIVWAVLFLSQCNGAWEFGEQTVHSTRPAFGKTGDYHSRIANLNQSLTLDQCIQGRRRRSQSTNGMC